MPWSKRQLCLAALKELGVVQRDTEATAEELADVCRRLDSMMAGWDGDGLHLGYPIPADDVVSLDTDSNLQASAVRAVVASLALEVAPQFGKEPSGLTLKNAKAGLDTLRTLAVTPTRQRLPAGVPRGAGARWPGALSSPFTPQPEPEITVGNDSVLDFD